MDSRSWLLLEHEDPAYRLPDDLRQHDPLGARDCGWVEQMRPFIRQFSRPGEQVLDPFCGFASTLVAAHLEGRRGLGYEIDPARAELSRERLRRLNAEGAEVIASDLLEAPPADPVDLCLTNIPYFGCDWPADAGPAQLYAAAHYEQYLDGLVERFHRIRDLLAPGRHCILMAENLRLGDRCVPLAWDVAQRVGGLFELCEERILLYPKPVEPLPAFSSRSDRSHEYALIFRKQGSTLDTDDALTLLRALRDAGFAFAIYGSFATWLTSTSAQPPADVDLLVAPDEDRLNALLGWLQAHHFRLSCWQQSLTLPIALADYRGRYYFRAERLDRSGGLLRLDLTFEQDSEPVAARLDRTQICQGLLVAS
ncbi:DNA methyltransferase [Pseudomonas indica]|uniref:Methyltransferase n=1 Tax=Pseudomonas indica TaxID=137658 RepID=A0A1G8TCZ5_9PSED|nr:DNA methyltransferase [Pseudomonas indica]SDJ39446.1 DNA methylase [Pseudomonas indica]